MGGGNLDKCAEWSLRRERLFLSDSFLLILCLGADLSGTIENMLLDAKLTILDIVICDR